MSNTRKKKGGPVPWNGAALFFSLEKKFFFSLEKKNGTGPPFCHGSPSPFRHGVAGGSDKTARIAGRVHSKRPPVASSDGAAVCARAHF
jgi:hypothetical protein